MLVKRILYTFKPYENFPVYIMTIELIDAFLFQEGYAQNLVLEEIQYNETKMQNVNNVHYRISPVHHSDVSTRDFVCLFMIINLCIILYIN